MAVRLGLGISRGTPLVVGTILLVGALGAWYVGFGAFGAVLFVIGSVTVLERRRTPRSISQGS